MPERNVFSQTPSMDPPKILHLMPLQSDLHGNLDLNILEVTEPFVQRISCDQSEL